MQNCIRYTINVLWFYAQHLFLSLVRHVMIPNICQYTQQIQYQSYNLHIFDIVSCINWLYVFVLTYKVTTYQSMKTHCFNEPINPIIKIMSFFINSFCNQHKHGFIVYKLQKRYVFQTNEHMFLGLQSSKKLSQ